jgi:sodium/bile acid cotransporter 7
VYNLRGGILAWVHDGGTVYDQNGETRRIHVYGRKWNLAPNSYQAVW